MNFGKIIRHAIWNRLGAPAGASLAADLVTLQAILDDLELQYVEGSVVDGAPAAADFDTDLAEATDEHYDGMLLMFTDGVNAGQAHVINAYLAANGNVAFSAEDIWTDVPGNGDNFVILPDIGMMAKAIYAALGTHDADIKALLVTVQADLDNPAQYKATGFATAVALTAAKAVIDAIKGIVDTTVGIIGIFHEQVDTAVNITAILGGETNVFDLSVADTRYIVRSLRLKCADPSTNDVYVRLYELVNDGLVIVDTFTIDAANFTTFHSLMDMFGLPHLAGDNLKVTVQASAGGPYTVTGQYSHAKTNV